MITIQPVRTGSQLNQFVTFPWRVNRGDPNWVPPITAHRRKLLDRDRNPYWQQIRGEFWLAEEDGRPAGTIAAIIDPARIRSMGRPVGAFGFFDFIEDQAVVNALLDAASAWLREQGMVSMIGPYNPGAKDDPGILVEGFDTRPAIMEGHNPPYYARLVEAYGLSCMDEMLARLWKRAPGKTFDQELPEKLARVAAHVRRRADLRIRSMDKRRWDSEIHLAWQIFNAAMAAVPGFVPETLEDFSRLSADFRQILDPRMALVAEVAGKPVGYILALPDVNEAFQKLNGRLGPLEMLKLLWYIRRVRRVSLKILMMLPEYQGRGIEALLVAEAGRQIWDAGFQELDMSLTGVDNQKSTRFQESLGFQVYRRYRIYQQELG